MYRGLTVSFFIFGRVVLETVSVEYNITSSQQ